MGFSGICYGSIMHFTELPLKDPIERGYSSDLLDVLANSINRCLGSGNGYGGRTFSWREYSHQRNY